MARNPRLDELRSFTIEATVELEREAGDGDARQVIASSDTPGVRLEVHGKGKLFGSVFQQGA